MASHCLQLIDSASSDLRISHLACAGSSDSGRKVDRFVRQYFQNKILDIFLSPVGFYTSDHGLSALERGCINEIRETRYKVYIGAAGKLRASGLPTMVISPWVL